MKDQEPSIWRAIANSSLQSKLAVASFVCGVLIACVCLFAVPPLGEIATSAISIVSELLVLAGGLLGVSATFDYKQQRFAARVVDALNRKQDKKTESDQSEEASETE